MCTTPMTRPGTSSPGRCGSVSTIEFVIAAAGSTVLIPAGMAHTFGNAGPAPSRYIMVLPSRIDELISRLHEVDAAEHPALYARFASRLLEDPG